MKKIVYIALMCSLLFALGGCNGQSSSSHRGSRWEATLSLADSLMRTRPDSALKLLYSLTPEGKPFPLGEGWGEAYYLLLLDAQNKCDTVFRSDTLQRALVSYYDRHGTPNERMRAYYLLGRACHDMGEVPKALDSYLTAVSVADTAEADCDYYHLCRVYGQMAEIFHQQFLPEDEMKATKNSERYARFANDTLSALKAYELRLRSYYLKNEMDSVLYYTQKAQEEYRKNGYNKKAATLLLPAISILLDRHEYNKARECMKYYEKESKLFDAQGNIANGWELYYYYKGVYMQAMNQTDSALYYYRKVLNTGNDETAYKGLLSAYEVINNTDSIAKYSRLFANANDTALLNYQRQTLRQTSAISSFNHYREQKDKARIRHLKDRNTIRLVASLFVLSILCSILYYHLNRKRTLTRIMVLTRNYENARIVLLQAQKEQGQLQQKTEEVLKLQELLELQGEKLRSYRMSNVEAAFRQTDIYKLFHSLRKYKKGYVLPSTTDWNNLEDTFRQFFPLFYKSLTDGYSFREEQLHVCILVWLDFASEEIALLTNKTKQHISTTKRRVNNKRFNIADASLLKVNLNNLYKEVYDTSL